MTYYYYHLNESKEISKVTFEESVFLLGGRATIPIGRDEIFGIKISTIFMSIDHGIQYTRDEVTVYHPILFETGILNGIRHSNITSRYRTYQDALQGHQDNIDETKALVATLCRLGSVRRAKKYFGYYEIHYLRAWYGKRNHKADKQLRTTGLEVKNSLKRLQEEWGCTIHSKN